MESFLPILPARKLARGQVGESGKRLASVAKGSSTCQHLLVMERWMRECAGRDREHEAPKEISFLGLRDGIKLLSGLLWSVLNPPAL